MKKLTKNEALQVHDRLLQMYPDRRCALEYSSPFQLLVAARLSAQCTDIRVNEVTEKLFEVYPTEKELAAALPEEVERIIFSCGLYKTKTHDIIAAAKQVVALGTIPDTMDGMLQLPGVGRKIANLLLGEIYGCPGVVIVDTHCIRLANRIGFCEEKDPKKIEMLLRKVIPAQTSLDFCHAIVWHGRKVCKAPNPDCEHCGLNDICRKNIVIKGKKK